VPFDGNVALARRGHQTIGIRHANLPATSFDQARTFEETRGYGDRLASHAQEIPEVARRRA